MIAATFKPPTMRRIRSLLARSHTIIPCILNRDYDCLARTFIAHSVILVVLFHAYRSRICRASSFNVLHEYIFEFYLTGANFRCLKKVVQ